MTVHAVTLHLPEKLYERFRQRSEWSHRSVETELLDAVASAAPVTDELPTELAEAVAALELLDDQELWNLARQTMPLEAGRELESLHEKQRNQRLTPAEEEVRARLIREYERAMLIRAQAASLLKSRGHDISNLLTTE